MLNGMKHLDVLDAKFGRERVLGGQCAIAVMLSPERHIVQLAPMQSLGFGERDGAMSPRVEAIAAIFAKGNFGAAASATIMQDMWEKWVFLATLAGCTSAMRAPVGADRRGTRGTAYFILGVQRRNQRHRRWRRALRRVRPFLERTLGMLTAEGSPLTASMFRDIKVNAPHRSRPRSSAT